ELGFDVAHAVGRTIFELFPFLPETVGEEYRRVFEESLVLTTEEVSHIAGREIATETRKIPIRREGRVVEAVTVIRDITERRQAERQIRERARIIDSTTDSVVKTDASGVVTMWNRGAERIFGYTSEEMMGRPVNILYRPQDQGRLAELIEALLRGEEIATTEVTCVHKDGSLVELALSLIPFRDTGDNVAEFVGISKDITGRKQAAERLRESENRYRAVVENAGEGIVVTQDRVLRFVNPNFMEVMGYSEEELTSRPFIEFVHPDDRERVMGIHTTRLKGEHVPLVYELRGIDKRGNTKWLENNGVLIEWNGGPATLNFLRDITERRKAEAALAESEQRFRKFFENEPEYCFMVSPQGTVLEANSAALHTLGYTKEELVGKPLETVYAPESHEKMRQSFAQWKETGELRDEEMVIITRNGDKRTVLLSAAQVLDEVGNPVHSISIQRDITERKQVEEAIRRQTELLDSIRSAQSLFITGGDPKPVFEALLNTLVEITNSEYGFLDEVLRDESGQLYKKSLALSNISWDDESRKLYEELRASNLEFRNLDNLAGAPAATGELVISNDPAHDPRSSGVPEGHPPVRSFMGIPMSFGGDLVGVAGVANREGGYNEEIASFIDTLISTCASIIQAVRDDRQRRQIAQALAESEEKYRTVVEDQTEFIVRWLPGGIRTFVNDSYCRYFGISRDEAIGTSFFPSITGDYLEAVRARIESFTPENPASTGEHQVVRPDGTVGWNQWTDRAIFDEEGKLIEFQSVGRDVTEHRKAQEQLAEAEMRYRTVAEFAHDWEYWQNPDGSLRYVSPSCERITGYPPEQFFSNPDLLLDIIFPEDKSLWKQHHDDSLRKLGPHDAQFRICRRDGHICWIEHTCRPVTDADGEFLGFRGSNRDITERKQAEQALRETTGLLETIFEHTHVLVAYLDPQFNFVRVNHAYAQADGHEPSFYPGKNHFDLFPNAENEEIFHMVTQTGVPYSTFGKPFEYAEHPERGVTYWDWTLVPIKHQDGSISGLVLTLADVTERKQAEQALQESERKFRGYIDNAPDGVLVVDRQGRYQEANDAACEISGYAREELLTMSIPDTLAPESRAAGAEHFKKVVTEGRAAGELAYLQKDGREGYWSVDAVKISEDRFLGFVKDITERKRVEQALCESEATLTSIFRVAPVGIGLECNRTLARVNDQVCAMSGYSREELVGQRA
ncbi:MAG: PAS domain S-box protein, partial [Planctomycetota bacterium]